MSARRLIFICGFLFFGSACALGYTLEYTAAELQEKLEKQFPHTIQKPLMSVVLSEPKVVLAEGQDSLGFKLQVEALFLTQAAVKGDVWMEGQLRYDPALGALFVDQPKVKQLDIAGVPAEWTQQIQKLLGSRQLQKHFEKTPIYQLKSADPKQALAKLMIKAVYVKNGKLKIELDPF